MARPRKYQTDAQRQAAFRQRSVVVDRAGLEELRTLLERFHVATRAASLEGDALARSLGGGTPETMLLRLCEHWESIAFPARDPQTHSEHRNHDHVA